MRREIEIEIKMKVEDLEKLINHYTKQNGLIDNGIQHRRAGTNEWSGDILFSVSDEKHPHIKEVFPVSVYLKALIFGSDQFSGKGIRHLCRRKNDFTEDGHRNPPFYHVEARYYKKSFPENYLSLIKEHVPEEADVEIIEITHNF